MGDSGHNLGLDIYRLQKFSRVAANSEANQSGVLLAADELQELQAAIARIIAKNSQQSLLLEQLSHPINSTNNSHPVFLKQTAVLHRKIARYEQVTAKLEQQLVEANQELQTTKKQFETFLYDISHDLRAPLRAIHGFSRIIIEDYADRLDDDGRKFLGFMHKGCLEMRDVIDSLLRISRSKGSDKFSEILKEPLLPIQSPPHKKSDNS